MMLMRMYQLIKIKVKLYESAGRTHRESATVAGCVVRARECYVYCTSK